ncbi:protein of unknown function [Pseudobutyrivibrio sp. YE44]|uniref:DUF3879 family protein n=1 Tax=Pseudobutyrivibrio sp. YE44 TaxID=1520802 RepID=UPI00087FF6AB|nr:DUF3879 family protein [Pseudobutyrivibrio sp. YE44]SDB47609.1 protein of unknown function [Pseudobutyrivibrio sp. YE44]
MGITGINGHGVQDNYQYKTINKNSLQYKAAAKDNLAGILEAEMMMTPEQKMLYEMLGGREANMRAHMQWYDSKGNLLNGPGGVAGMSMDGVSLEEAHQIIDVPEEWKEKMFQETKRHYIQENGVSNGDTTRRSEIFEGYQRSTSINKRLKGTWTLGQYEQAYKMAFYNAVKKENPNWQIGQSFDSSIINKISRKDIEASLVKTQGEYGTNLVSKGFDISL